MAVRKYNPKRIVGSFRGVYLGREFAIQFRGFMDGSFVQASYDEDRVTEHVGSDGGVTLVLNPNMKAGLTVTLAQGSVTNTELSLLVPNAALNYLPTGSISFEDLNGLSKIVSPEAWIRTSAPVEFGNSVVGRQWVFGLSDAVIAAAESEDF